MIQVLTRLHSEDKNTIYATYTITGSRQLLGAVDDFCKAVKKINKQLGKVWIEVDGKKLDNRHIITLAERSDMHRASLILSEMDPEPVERRYKDWRHVFQDPWDKYFI